MFWFVFFVIAAVAVGGLFLWLFSLLKRKGFVCIGLIIFFFGCWVYWADGNGTVMRDGDNYNCQTNRSTCACVLNVTQQDEDSVNLSLGSISRSISSFWPSRGGYEPEYGHSLKYWLFHLLTLIYISVIIIAVLGLSVVNKIVARFWLLRCRKSCMKTNVFWDFCNEARWLAESMDDKHSVLFALRENKSSFFNMKSDESVEILTRDGFRWVYAAPGRTGWIASAGRHYFLSGNGHENVSGAQELIKAYTGKDKIKVFVRISAAADDDVLYAWADKLNEEKSNVEVIVIREEAIVSSKFLEDHSMLDCPKIKIYPDVPKAVVDGRFRLLIIGFGNQGERLMNDSICDAQYLDLDGTRVPMEVKVVDRDEVSFGWYKGNCQTACSRYGIDFEKLDAQKEEFWDWLRKQDAFSRIIVCTGDDRLNISIAHDVSKLYRVTHADTWQSCKKPQQAIVYARVRDALISQYVTTTYDGKYVPFLTFGSMKDIYKACVLTADKWWKAAECLNWLYYGDDKDKITSDDAWRYASSLDKESSFASVFHQRNLLRILGYELDKGRNADHDAIESNWRSMETEKDECRARLARIEHLRWMAFHFVRGIECWHPTEEELRLLAQEKLKMSKSKYEVMTSEEKKKEALVKPNMLLKTGRKWLHAALVEFNELPQVDLLFNGINDEFGFKANSNLQNKDYDLTNDCDAIRMAELDLKRTEKKP